MDENCSIQTAFPICGLYRAPTDRGPCQRLGRGTRTSDQLWRPA